MIKKNYWRFLPWIGGYAGYLVFIAAFDNWTEFGDSGYWLPLITSCVSCLYFLFVVHRLGCNLHLSCKNPAKEYTVTFLFIAVIIGGFFSQLLQLVVIIYSSSGAFASIIDILGYFLFCISACLADTLLYHVILTDRILHISRRCIHCEWITILAVGAIHGVFLILEGLQSPTYLALRVLMLILQTFVYFRTGSIRRIYVIRLLCIIGSTLNAGIINPSSLSVADTQAIPQGSAPVGLVLFLLGYVILCFARSNSKQFTLSPNAQ